jgi:hypothetical protein
MALIKPEQLRSGSYNITGSLFGTSSYANFALTASFALNGGGGGSSFPYTGSAIISGSLAVTGSVRATAGFTGSLQGTASNAINSTFANNANLAYDALSAQKAVAPSGDWVPAKPNGAGFSPYNLGSPESAWNSLYIRDRTIYFLSESIGAPTISSSLSVEEDPDGSSRFILGTKEPGSTKKNIVISDKGASLAITASYALTASFAQNAQTASFFSGSISNAVSASYALTASYAMNSSVVGTPFRISTGSISASVNIGSTIFLITNNNVPVLTVSQSGIVILATQSIDPTGTAPNGAIYFTSSSFFIGLD